jgi:spore coat protein CotH
MKNKSNFHLFLRYFLFLLCPSWMIAQSGTHLFDESKVHEIRITFSDPYFWDTLSVHYNLSLNDSIPFKNIPLMASSLSIDGTVLDSVAVKQKGFYSNWGSEGSLKKPLKIDFNEFKTDGSYDGVKSLNLQNGFQDPSMLHDAVSYKILRDFGIAAPRTSFAKVFINDHYWGLYTVVESVNKTFLKEHFKSNKGNLYKANWALLNWQGEDATAYYDDYELKTNNAKNDWSDLVGFVKMVTQTPTTKFRDTLTKYFDTDVFFRCLVVDVALNNWDSYLDHGRNYYLYNDPEDQKFHWIPWDYNLAFAGNDYTLQLKELINEPSYNRPLIEKTIRNTKFKPDYYKAACELQRDVFNNAHLDDYILTSAARIRPDLALDSNKFFTITQFDSSLVYGVMATQTFSFPMTDSILVDTGWLLVDTIITFTDSTYFKGLIPFITDRQKDFIKELNVLKTTCDIVATEEELPNEQVEGQIRLYPNPVTDKIYLRGIEKATLILYDSRGKKIMEQRNERPDPSLDISLLSDGIYFLQIVEDTGQRMVKKVVKLTR